MHHPEKSLSQLCQQCLNHHAHLLGEVVSIPTAPAEKVKSSSKANKKKEEATQEETSEESSEDTEEE